MKFAILLILPVFLFVSCQKPPAQISENSNAEIKRYPLKGKVISVDKEKKSVEVEHEAIPGFMDAMTMKFQVKDDWVWEDLAKDSQIQAELAVDEKGDYWLEKLGILAVANPNLPQPAIDERFAQVGKDVPDFQLTDQDGKDLNFKDYRGKIFALTFIYSRCPLPDYCIKMSLNFSDANKEILNSGLKDKVRLLSISFDPANDTPQKLREYGIGYMGKGAKPDFSVWQLAVGKDPEVRKIADFFGLRYEIDPNDKTQFNHSLRTVIIDENGKVSEILAGNDWFAGDLVAKLKKLSEKTSAPAN